MIKKEDIKGNDIEEVMDTSFEGMEDLYRMDFEFETASNRKKVKATEKSEDIRREEDPEVIKTVLPGMDETVEPIPPEALKGEIKFTTSKFNTIYDAPPFSLLNANTETEDMHEEHKRQAARVAGKLEEVMKSFGIEAKVIHISRGASVTQYELQPHSGVKVSRIKNLSEDIALNLAAPGIRIEAPIPGKAAIGIEVPNKENAAVMLRDLLESPEFKAHPSKIAFATGRDIGGKVVVADIARAINISSA